MRWEIRLQLKDTILQTTVAAATLELAIESIRKRYPKEAILSIIGFKGK